MNIEQKGVVTINLAEANVIEYSLPEDYYMYHFSLHKGLTKMLCPAERRGVDIVFIYSQPNIRSLCKKIDRFWHNYRKTQSKESYINNKNRTTLFIIKDYESATTVMEWFEAQRKDTPTIDFNFRKIEEVANYDKNLQIVTPTKMETTLYHSITTQH